MDYIKSWTFCICITLVLSVIFSVLSPKGSMGRFYKVIISVFIFISFLYPLGDFDASDFRLDFDFESEYENVVEKAAETEVENAVLKMLMENGIYNSSVTAKVSQQGEEISVDSVNISVTDDYSPKEVKNTVFEKLGIVADVKNIGE